MREKLVLVVTAVVAIGIFALPSTISLFAGQHAWYNISDVGNEVPCEKCHADVAEEMKKITGPHTGETGYERMKCGYCHRLPPIWRRNQTFENYTYASGDGTGSQPGVESHAASTIPCMYCHSGNKSGVVSGTANHTGIANMDCWSCHQVGWQNPNKRKAHEGRYTNSEDCRRCHANAHTGNAYYIPPAGGFNLTANASDTGKLAAHKAFVFDAIGNPDMEDANEACIACHTGIPVRITWTHAYSLEFNASYDRGLLLPPTHFNTSNYNTNGTVVAVSYGNWSGGANVGDWPSGNITIWG